MEKPELVFIAGCNAAGKSTFIRTRLNELQHFQILMTDVYKGRTKQLARQAMVDKKSILIETVFNDKSFKDIIDDARNAGYKTSMVVLFLDSIKQSINRVGVRGIEQNGIIISGGNIKINFNESFKNVANYFFYFDRSDFIYTGTDGINQLIMSFKKDELLAYNANELDYPKKFADYSFHNQRLNEDAYKIILENKDFRSQTARPEVKFKL